MSATPHARPTGDEPIERRSGATDVVAGFLAAFGIFFAVIGIVWHPLRLIPLSFVLALVAASMGGRNSRLAGAAVAIVAVCFFVGMTVAVLTHRVLW